MKFIVPVSTICKAMTQVANICTSNPSNPDDVSQYLLVEVRENEISLLGTDKNVQLNAIVPLSEEDVHEGEGKFLIAATKVNTFFKTLGNEDSITFELEDNSDELVLRSNRAKYILRIRPFSEDDSFPSFSNVEGSTEKVFKIAEKKLHAMIERSIFCVSKENHREYLKGVRFEVENDNFTIFALDGHRMAAIETKLNEPVSEEIKFLMTLRGVKELEKLLDSSSGEEIEIKATEEYVSVSKNNCTLTNRLSICQYPNVRGVLPKETAPNIPVNLEDLKTYVKRVSSFSNKRVNSIQLLFTRQNLLIKAENSDNEGGEANLLIDYHERDRIDINLNSDFLIDFLNAIHAEQVVFGFSPPYNNTMLVPSNNDQNELGLTARYVVSHIQV